MKYYLGLLFLFALGDLSVHADVIPHAPDARRRGHIWIVDQDSGSVREFDRRRGLLWKKEGFVSPRDVDLRADGTILVGGLDCKVVEVNPKGEITWTYTAAEPVYSVRFLKNRNVMVAEYRRLTEVDREGHVSWECEVSTCPEDVVVLADGSYLVARYGGSQILEIARDKTQRRTLNTPGAPMSVQRLENGNIFVGEVSGQRGVEWDSDGGMVREFKIDANCPSVYRTRRGTLLVSTWNRVYEADDQGKELWSTTDVARCRRAREF